MYIDIKQRSHRLNAPIKCSGGFAAVEPGGCNCLCLVNVRLSRRLTILDRATISFCVSLHVVDSVGGSTLQLDDTINALAAAAEVVLMLIYIIAICNSNAMCCCCYALLVNVRTYGIDDDGSTQLIVE